MLVVKIMIPVRISGNENLGCSGDNSQVDHRYGAVGSSDQCFVFLFYYSIHTGKYMVLKLPKG